MIIVIDGYNLLRSIYPHVKGKLDAQRQQLIKELGLYKSKKSGGIKHVILVFDAGPFGHATREVHFGIVVMFSGQRRSADDWIIEFVEKNREKELLVITRDREIVAECKKNGVDTLSVDKFYDRVTRVLLDGAQASSSVASDQLYKFESDDDFKIESSEGLDLLMEQASVQGYDKEEDDSSEIDRRGRSHTVAKKDKKLRRKLKKL